MNKSPSSNPNHNIQSYFNDQNNRKILSFGLQYQSALLEVLSRNYLEKNSSSNILDVGSGSGSFSNIVKKILPTANFILLDLARILLSNAEIKNKIQGDAHFLPISSRSVDILLCRQALHYLNTSLAFGEFHRVLKKHGIVLISSEWWLDGDESKEEEMWITELSKSRDKPPSKLLNRQQILANLADSGFEILHRTDHYEKISINIKDWLSLYDSGEKYFTDKRIKLLENQPNSSLSRGYPYVTNEIVTYTSKWIVLVCSLKV